MMNIGDLFITRKSDITETPKTIPYHVIKYSPSDGVISTP